MSENQSVSQKISLDCQKVALDGQKINLDGEKVGLDGHKAARTARHRRLTEIKSGQVEKSAIGQDMD